MAEDYYSRLGVPPDAEEDAIVSAYRREVAKVHPDVNDDPDARQRFHGLQRAKAVLSDAERRAEYDRLGHERFTAQDRESGTTGASDARPRPPTRARPAPEPARPPGGPQGGHPILEALLRIDSGSRPGERGARRRAATGAAEPGVIDLEGVLRRARAGAGWSDRSAHPHEPTGGDERTCPKCRGRGSFDHVIDTGRGRHRRIEPCERCGGSGSIPA